MFWVVFIEELAHFGDVSIVYDELLIDAVDSPVDLADDGDHWLYVEVPTPAEGTEAGDFRLSFDMEMLFEAHICSTSSHSWKPLTFQAYTTGGGPCRIDRLQSSNFRPSDRGVVVDGGPKHSSMSESAGTPRLDDL